MSKRVPCAGSRRIWGAWATMTIWAGAAAALLVGCGGSGVSTLADQQAQLASSPPSLGICVRRWNYASLGIGFEKARLEAFEGTPALMLRFPNGACGLAFPRTAEGAERGQMVNFLEGNYHMYWSPLGYVSASEFAALQADADRQTNVFVRKSNGHVIPRRNARIFVVPSNVFIDESNCARFVSPAESLTERYEVVLQSGASCAVVRTLGWAWPAREKSAEDAGRPPTSTMSIIGWRCVGSELIRDLTPVTYEKITCTRGGSTVELRDLAREAISQPPPSGG